MNYIHESDSSILVLLQTRMIKCGKVSGEARQIVYTTNCIRICDGFCIEFCDVLIRFFLLLRINLLVFE